MDATLCIPSQREISQKHIGRSPRYSDLARCIAQLPKSDQLMLQLLLVNNLTDAAVADILGLSEAAVERASVRVLRRLQLI